MKYQDVIHAMDVAVKVGFIDVGLSTRRASRPGRNCKEATMPVHAAGPRLYRSVPFKHLVKKTGSAARRPRRRTSR